MTVEHAAWTTCYTSEATRCMDAWTTKWWRHPFICVFSHCVVHSVGLIVGPRANKTKRRCTLTWHTITNVERPISRGLDVHRALAGPRNAQIFGAAVPVRLTLSCICRRRWTKIEFSVCPTVVGLLLAPLCLRLECRREIYQVGHTINFFNPSKINICVGSRTECHHTRENCTIEDRVHAHKSRICRTEHTVHTARLM